MTSAINPNNINGNYPLAGVPNNTQGMRDNFTNTKTNFEFAAGEISELQSKAVLKAGLGNSLPDNNMADNLIYAARIQDFSATVLQIAATAGIIEIDYAAAHYQTINTTGSISLALVNLPASGSVGMLRLRITINSTLHTLTLPASVTQGLTGIQGYSAGVITFGSTGIFEFGLLTSDGGTNFTIFDLNRPLSFYTNPVTIAATTAATSTTTGALRVAGGLGIVGNLHVGGSIVLSSINVSGVVTANDGFVGDLKGSVFADDSTIMLDAVDNQLLSSTVRLTGSEDLAAAAAVRLDVTASFFTTATAETATLAAGTEGLIKTFAMVATAGDMVITVTNAGWKASGTGTITFDTRGDACTLQYINSKWFCIGNNGCTFA